MPSGRRGSALAWALRDVDSIREWEDPLARDNRRTPQAPTVAIIGTRGYPSFYGGFETAVRRLAPHLADRGWRVRVYGRPGTHLRPDQGLDARIETVMTRGLDSRSLSTL